MRAALIGLALLLMAGPRSGPTRHHSAADHHAHYRLSGADEEGRRTPLQGLKSIRLYWRVDAGPETVVTLPASSIKGGLDRRLRLTVPATSGVLSVTLTAVDMSSNESARTAPLTKTIAPPAGKE